MVLVRWLIFTTNSRVTQSWVYGGTYSTAVLVINSGSWWLVVDELLMVV